MAALSVLYPYVCLILAGSATYLSDEEDFAQVSFLQTTLASGSKVTTESAGAAEQLAWTPQFFAPKLTPTTFMIVSSPTQAKVVYTTLRNFKSETGRSYALVDSGLGEPCGIAVDRERGHLYVADRLAKKIFRYSLVIRKQFDKSGVAHYTLSTDANRLTILNGRSVEWVTVDYDGDVFYSDTDGKSINKITAALMERIAAGEIQAEDLPLLSAKQQEAEASANLAASLASGEDIIQADASSYNIMEIYQGAVNPHLSMPGGVVADGVRLYWTNMENGTQSGSVVRGFVNPKPPPTLTQGGDPAPFPASILANNTVTAYGVAKSNTMVFYSSVVGDAGYVFGVNAQKYDGNVYAFTRSLSQPRGLVWDGDNTVFVADEAENTVYSFPVGRLGEDAPLTTGVQFLGAYGVAILTENDEAFTASQRAGAAASYVSTTALLLICSALSLTLSD